MTLLNKDNAKKIQRKSKVVNFPDYDLDVKLVSLKLSSQLDFEDANKDLRLGVLSMIQLSCFDEDDNPVFDKIEDVEDLPADITIQIFKECLKLNNLVEQDLEKLAKNS